MFFIYLVFGAALTLELFGSYISIIGLSKNASYILVGLAVTLDFVKIIIATVLYKEWKSLHGFLKYTIIPPFIFLVLFTSSGAYAFLTQEFSKTTTGQEQAQTRIDSLEKEREKLETRKKEIDGQVAKLPADSFQQRKRMTDLFAKEIEYINTRTIEMDKEIPDLKIKNLADTTQSGTIGSIAKAYGTSPDSIIKILVFLMVLVIDPLAIVLLTIANFLLEKYKKEKIEALNKKLEIEALLAVEAKKNPPIEVIAPTPARVHTKAVEAPIEPIEDVLNELPDAPVEIAPVAIQEAVKPAKIKKQDKKSIPQAIQSSTPVLTDLSTITPSTPITSVVQNIAPFTKPLNENSQEAAPSSITDMLEEFEEPEWVNQDYLNSEVETLITKPEVLIAPENNLADEEEVMSAFVNEKVIINEGPIPVVADETFEDFQEELNEHEAPLESVKNNEMPFAAKEVLATVKNPVVEVKKTLSFPPKPKLDITEQINDDIFNNYEVSDSELEQLMGTPEKEKGFNTKNVLNEKLFD